jgi:hypothetical protein
MRLLYGNNANWWISLFIWIVNLLTLYAHYDREYQAITFNFVVMMYFLSILKSVNVAAKYATFTQEYRERLLTRYISDEELSKYFLLGAWSRQDNHVVKREIAFAMRRKMIDTSTFKASFIDPPSEPIQKALTDTTVIADYCKGHSNYKIPNKEAYVQYYDCRAIMYNLLAMHTSYRAEKGIIPFVSAFLTAVWLCLPGLTRLLVGANYCGNFWAEIIVFFVCSLFYCFVFFINFHFFTRAYIDYDRIDFLNKQLWQMLSPLKVPTVKHKVFPTINIADPISL